MLALGLRGNGRLIEPGFWKRRFQIGNAVLMGKAKTHLMGVAAHRAHQRIDRGVECVPLFPCSLGVTIPGMWPATTILKRR